MHHAIYYTKNRLWRVSVFLSFYLPGPDADLGLLQHPRLTSVNYYHKELHLGCCSSPRPASDDGGSYH